MRLKLLLLLLLIAYSITPSTGQQVVDEVIELYESTTLEEGLHLVNSTLILHGPIVLTVPSGSSLIVENSAITGDGFSIIVEKDAKLRIVNSRLSNFGSVDLESLSRNIQDRYLWLGPDYTRSVEVYGMDGLVIMGDGAVILNSTFENYTGIRVYSSGNVVKGNRFLGMKHEGLAFMPGSDGNIVSGNYFGHASRMDREIFGLRFYPGTSDEEVCCNTFEMLPIGMMVANVPPWDAGSNFTIHGNLFRDTIFGFTGKLRDSHVYNETFIHNLQPVHFEASTNLLFENSTISDVTFQPEEIGREYFDEVWSRGLLRNMAYWMFGFYCSKIMLGLGWSGRNITIRDNVFSNAPPYTMAIDFDISRGIEQVYILNNTFLNIGNYIPEGYVVRNDWTGYNRIANVTPIEGACIALEGSDHVYIEGNRFINVLNGISTSSPDALGNFGDLTIRDNVLVGLGSFSWEEQRYAGGWWSGRHPVTEESIGIAIGMGYIVKSWKAFPIYYKNSTTVIEGNEILGFPRPLVLDFRRTEEMGVKRALITRNLVENLDRAIILCDPPNSVLLEGNEVVKRGLAGLVAPKWVKVGKAFDFVILFNNTSSLELKLRAVFLKDGLAFREEDIVVPPHTESFRLEVRTSLREAGIHSVGVEVEGIRVLKAIRVVPAYPALWFATGRSALLLLMAI